MQDRKEKHCKQTQYPVIDVRYKTKKGEKRKEKRERKEKGYYYYYDHNDYDYDYDYYGDDYNFPSFISHVKSGSLFEPMLLRALLHFLHQH